MYKYTIRKGHNSQELLIEFSISDDEKLFTDFLIQALKPLNANVKESTDLWMNDEVILTIRSDIGQFDLSIDNWGFAFIMAENNQAAIPQIDMCLNSNDLFVKESP